MFEKMGGFLRNMKKNLFLIVKFMNVDCVLAERAYPGLLGEQGFLVRAHSCGYK